ncbi:hypothetical protein TSOC_008692, partial [Tetrabaena socialis]
MQDTNSRTEQDRVGYIGLTHAVRRSDPRVIQHGGLLP